MSGSGPWYHARSEQVRLGLEDKRLFDFGNGTHCFFSLEVEEVVLWVKYFPCKLKDLQSSPRTQVES